MLFPVSLVKKWSTPKGLAPRSLLEGCSTRTCSWQVRCTSRTGHWFQWHAGCGMSMQGNKVPEVGMSQLSNEILKIACFILWIRKELKPAGPKHILRSLRKAHAALGWRASALEDVFKFGPAMARTWLDAAPRKHERGPAGRRASIRSQPLFMFFWP